MSSKLTTQSISKYYKKSTWDYLLFYRSAWHQQMHYGFSRNQPRDLNPMENLVWYMAQVAEVGAGQLVLDAGCGLGGGSFILNKKCQSRCVGISLVDTHMTYAYKKAQKQNLASRFIVADFHKAPFKKSNFDIIIAIESFDHAFDKEAWIKQMAGLLKPGGKLLIADGFRQEGQGSQNEEEEYQKFLAGWAVPHLCTPAQVCIWAKNAGLKNFHHENLTEEILPHAYNIYKFGSIALPVRKFLSRLGLGKSELTGNAAATYYQYRTLRWGLWNYWFFGWERPIVDLGKSDSSF